MKLILATKNNGKVRELSEILKGHEIITMSEAGFTEDIAETGKTFEENALIKAEAVCAASHLPVIADDSGLEVFALDMRPSIYSARYAGEEISYEEKMKILLGELEDKKDRRARFVCCAALCFPDDRKYTFRGEVYGSIAFAPKGNNGFGYDPIFLLEDGRTFAEISAEEKNEFSHRSRAFHKLFDYLKII